MMFGLRKVLAILLLNLYMKITTIKLRAKKYKCRRMDTVITKEYVRIGLIFDRNVTEFPFDIGSGWKNYRFDHEIRLVWQGETKPKDNLKHAMNTLVSFIENLPIYGSPIYKRLMTHQDGKAMVETNE